MASLNQANVGTSDRIKNLSPERRRLLELLLEQTPEPEHDNWAIVQDYYNSLATNSVTEIDELTGEVHNTFLTFAPFPEIVPGFSWVLSGVNTPETRACHLLAVRAQQQLRKILFRNVDFSACKRVLDVGCGYGSDLITLARRYPHLELCGYTIAAEQARIANAKAQRLSLTNRVIAYHRDSAKDEFPGMFDMFWGVEAIHHIRDKDALLGNIERHLHEHGHLVMADFISNLSFPLEHHETSSYFITQDEWIDLLSRHGLEVLDCVDISQEVANSLHDPEFETTIQSIPQIAHDRNITAAFRSYDQLGRLLRKRMASYVLLTAQCRRSHLQDARRITSQSVLGRPVPFADVAPNYYQIEWRPVDLASRPTSSSDIRGDWIVVADVGDLGTRLTESLRAAGNHCLLVKPADGFERIDEGCYALDLRNPAHVTKLFDDLASAGASYVGVIHLCGCGGATAKAMTAADVEAAERFCCGSLLHLLQALGAVDASIGRRLLLVTEAAQAVGPARPSEVDPVAASLWGLARVAALEYPGLACKLVDVDSSSPREVIDVLMEMASDDGETEVAYRNGIRHLARLVRRMPGWEQNSCEFGDGHHLVTGGLGSLGLALAGYLVERGARHLTLLSRSAPSGDARATIERLETTGARIHIVQGDVARTADVAAVLDVIGQSASPLRGIFHLAGVLDDGVLELQTWSRCATVMRPKVSGAWNLHTLTRELELEFFVCFSSTASLYGARGQGSYAAANAFLDALMHRRQREGLPGLSINWGPWAEAGMAARLDEHDKKRMAAIGVDALTTAQCMDAMDDALSQDLGQVGVCTVNWNKFLRQYAAGQVPPLLADLIPPGEALSAAEHAAQACQDLREHLESGQGEQRLHRVGEYLREQVFKILSLDLSFPVDGAQPLNEVGLDSLMVVELRNAIKRDLGVELSLKTLIQLPSIDTLSTALSHALGLEESGSWSAATSSPSLSADCVLDPSIVRADPFVSATTESRAIWLTGATGFLGAYLLRDLMRASAAEVYVLVRAPDVMSGMARIRQNLDRYGIWEDAFAPRIVPVTGDLSQPRFGLSEQAFHALAGQIEVIYHCGAQLNFLYSYQALKPVNVLGTQEILRLATTGKLKSVHYISTVGVLESTSYAGRKVTEADPLLHSDGIFLGYSQSKWVAERLMAIGRDRGIPVNIYRPPLISGDMRTGAWNTDDYTCRLLKGCIQLGSLPRWDIIMDLAPVDYVSGAVVYLSQRNLRLGQVFHLVNPEPANWNSFADWISAIGYPLRQVSYQEWRGQLRAQADPENTLYPLMPSILERDSEQGLTQLYQREHGVQLNFSATLAALAGAPVCCPPVDQQLLEHYFAYFARTGFLPKPTAQS